jgi:hypothetical protein
MLPKELEELHKRINTECEKFEEESDEAARNLGIVLSHAALSGRRQGFFAGMKKEAERSQKLIEALEEYAKLLGEELDEVIGFVNVHQWKSSRHEKGKELRERIVQLKTEYNQQPEK